MPDNLFASIAYDLLITFVGAAIAYLCGRILYERVWKGKRYGGWIVRVLREDGSEVTRREISPAFAERILNDKNEMSVFVKGLGSTHTERINDDPVKDESIDSGLLEVGDPKWKEKLKLSNETKNLNLSNGKHKRLLTLDFQHNPPQLVAASSLPFESPTSLANSSPETVLPSPAPPSSTD